VSGPVIDLRRNEACVENHGEAWCLMGLRGGRPVRDLHKVQRRKVEREERVKRKIRRFLSGIEGRLLMKDRQNTKDRYFESYTSIYIRIFYIVK
jgi:hypothetical protein